MWIKNFKKAHLILLYLTWLLCLPGDPSVFVAALKSQNSFHLRRQPPANKYRQNNVCLNHSDGEFVEHPENCRLFYLCKEDGQAVVASCPPTMLFNADSKLCDKATNVRCRTNAEETSSTMATSATTTTTTAPASVTNEIAVALRYCIALPLQQEVNRLTYIGSSISCQRYYICYYGQALLQECSTNLHWNGNIGKCDLPANADCRLQQNNNNNNNSNNNGSNNNNGSGNGNGDNGNGLTTDQFINCPNYGQHIYPHLGRCDFFIYCVKGHATLQQCPFYYHFDIVTKSCKWRTIAVCVRDLNIDFQKSAKIV